MLRTKKRLIALSWSEASPAQARDEYGGGGGRLHAWTHDAGVTCTRAGLVHHTHLRRLATAVVAVDHARVATAVAAPPTVAALLGHLSSHTRRQRVVSKRGVVGTRQPRAAQGGSRSPTPRTNALVATSQYHTCTNVPCRDGKNLV